ncbi:MAG: hypothetical protein KH847_11180, partial [Clostridiales bacterium]|nr:hypothetical protein [Clostridiales bacterium]
MRNLLPLALDGTDPASISLTVLLTGLIVVFLVLICLTFIIYLPTVQIVADDDTDIKHLIGRNGEVIDALQQLTRLAVQ